MSQDNSPATRLQNFADMSATLTGFQSSVINPLLDPVNLKQLYLDTADAKAGATLVDQLIAQFLSLKGQPAQTLANTLLATNDANPPQTALVARSILKLWYLGSWYPAVPASDPTAGQGTVVSANAYIGGLAWRAAQAHPMGSSQMTFGYWASPPPPLDQFGVDTSSQGGTHG
ncbi:MAG TPA: sorbitol dehydrogenase [Thermoanaerobaculia bacterium]|jgi:hypothetical protein|nr:sorbitol dehydrogenase [Thermoanaerobaculia bacterium]